MSLRNLSIRSMNRVKLSTFNVRETKLPTGCDVMISGFRLICFPSNVKHYGNGFVIAPRMINRIHRFAKISDRVCLIQLKATPRKIITIINGYGPTLQRTERNEEEADAFYSDLFDAMKFAKSGLIFFTGDFNSKLGQREEKESFMGRYCRGHRNANGERLANFKNVGKGFRGRPRMMLPQRLHEDLKPMNEALSMSLEQEGLKLQTTRDLSTFREVAQNRKAWQLFVNSLILYNQNR